MQNVCVLGATGSIGVSTLDVISRHPERYSVFALTADRRWQLLATQCLAFRPAYAVLNDPQLAKLLAAELAAQNCPTQVLVGSEALEQVASHAQVDVVMAAIVGAAGLLPTLAAVKASKKVLLANKEALVMAGSLFIKAVETYGATLLPIDSEHNAIFQCLPTGKADFHTQGVFAQGVRKVLLTASGGPFRSSPISELAQVTPEQACAHPNWSMGQKISVDSATMANKGLELIEACHLFKVKPADVQVVIHPQSVIHSMVEYIDGSVIAQLGNPDMRTPIAHALAWPERIESGVASLDIIATAHLDFSAPDLERFPCLAHAQEAASIGGTAPAIFNAANEVAVAAFLARQIRFDQIAKIIEGTLAAVAADELRSLDQVLEIDQRARLHAKALVVSAPRPLETH